MASEHRIMVILSIPIDAAGVTGRVAKTLQKIVGTGVQADFAASAVRPEMGSNSI